MAVYNGYVVEYRDSGGNWVEIEDVQSLYCTVGRTTAVDPFPVSKATIVARYPDGYTTPYADLVPGADIRWMLPPGNMGYGHWNGSVANVVTDWGIPWDGTTGSDDYITIECEGALAIWGRSNLTVVGGGNDYLQNILDVIDQPVSSFTSIPLVSASRVKYSTAQPYPAQEWLQKAAASMILYIQDGIGEVITQVPVVQLKTQSQTIGTNVSFSDTTNDSTHRIYSEIVFEGLGDNYYTRVTVTPDDAAQVSVSVGSDPHRELIIDTINESSSDAASVASGWLAQFSSSIVGVSQIVARSSGQHTQNLDTLAVGMLQPLFGEMVGRLVEIEFRGDTYYATIEGVTVSVDLSEATFTYQLSPAETSYWFTLDSSDFGLLDTDRLAYL